MLRLFYSIIQFVHVLNQTKLPSVATPKLDTTQAERHQEKKKTAKALNQLALYTFTSYTPVYTWLVNLAGA